MRRVSIRSAPHEAADILREEILSHAGDGEEWLLGSEEDMIRTLGISRPTLRQAARLLEQEQLLVVRRGLGGGLFGRRPTSEAVSQMAAVYLRARGAAREDLAATQILLGVECARLAAANGDSGRRAALRDHCTERARGSTADPVEAAADFQRRVAELAGSPVLQLLVDVLLDLSRGSEPLHDHGAAERQARTLRRQVSIAQAVAAGNATLAGDRMREHLIAIHDRVDAAAGSAGSARLTS
jgi:DNA-binding FadR family transcriptional regulator